MNKRMNGLEGGVHWKDFQALGRYKGWKGISSEMKETSFTFNKFRTVLLGFGVASVVTGQSGSSIF